MTVAEARRTVNVYRDQTAALRSRVDAYVTRAWAGLDGYDEADIARFVDLVVPVVQGAQLQVAALTDSFLARFESQMLDRPAAPIGVAGELVSIEALRGVPAAEVYRRPGVDVWTALKRGALYEDAVAKGLARAQELAATDVQLAEAHTSRHILEQNDGVVGYRRVLEGRGSCALCVTASTQRYHREDLMPIHVRCDCSVAPIYGDRDPGRVLDAPEPEEGTEVEVHEHGEIGPVLTAAGQSFTGPADV